MLTLSASGWTTKRSEPSGLAARELECDLLRRGDGDGERDGRRARPLAPCVAPAPEQPGEQPALPTGADAIGSPGLIGPVLRRRPAPGSLARATRARA